MKEDLQLKLQAFLDGELSSSDAQTIQALLARDPAARELLAEFTNTRDVIMAHEATIKVPESREFYWSKIKREISREPISAPVRRVSFTTWLHRALVPAGAAAAVVIAILLSLPQANGVGDGTNTSSDTATFTYHNYATGTTLVWLDYGAAENDFSEMESDDTLDL
jgi:anti-sigma factor RsiW